MLYVSNFLFLFFSSSSTTCHSAFYKVLSFPYPTRAVFIFTKIQLTLAPTPPPPVSGSLQTTFDQYPKRTDSTNYVSTTKHFERRQLIAGHFVQMETLAALIYQLLTFHCRADVLFPH